MNLNESKRYKLTHVKIEGQLYALSRNKSWEISIWVYKSITLSKIGNSALNLVHTKSWIFSLVPGSWPANWLHGNAKISNPRKNFKSELENLKIPIDIYILSIEWHTLAFVLVVQFIQLTVIFMCQSTATIVNVMEESVEIS